MTLFNGAAHHFPALTESPVDVSGAGEAAISAFAVAIAEGLDYKLAAACASRAAGFAVQKFGTTVVPREEMWS
jgi:bifunctional ADP-heptose synthase (sugar kinase/adenylyltransferase)